tara:strand:+ start:675 stop:1319 length:645 start_codon:yes stop_codon:yes gene_type:complete
MPYREGHLGERLNRYPEGHRGYATPGVKYPKGKFKAGREYRPTVVSGREIDNRMGLKMGQVNTKDPFHNKEIPIGLVEKKDKMKERLTALRNKLDESNSKRIAKQENEENMSSINSLLIEFSRIKKYIRTVSGKNVKEARQALSKTDKSKSLGERMRTFDPAGFEESQAYRSANSKLRKASGERRSSLRKTGAAVGATATAGAVGAKLYNRKKV